MSRFYIDLLSDTHGQHKAFKTEGGDILIHAGDCSRRGKIDEVLPFLDWYAEQDYSHLILIAGNHDFCFESNPGLLADECKQRSIILLNDSGYLAEVDDQKIKVWGSPVQPRFHDWAFNRDRGEDIRRHWDIIPTNTEILITHGPPANILDEVSILGCNLINNVGCKDLLEKIKQTDVKLHVFGHIHEGRGFHYEGPVTYVNASSLDRMYYPADRKPMRVWREVFQDDSIGYVL